MTPQEILPLVINLGKSINPKFNVQNKSSNWFMRLLGFFFGASFMSDVWTTIGNTTWRPDYTGQQEFLVMAHEIRHIQQYQKYGLILMAFLYLFPITLVPFLLVPIVFVPKMWYIFVVLSIVCLSPVPAYFRMLFELDAYKVQLSMWVWVYGKEDALLQIPSMAEYFTDSLYYFMAWPFKNYIINQLNQTIADTNSGKVLKDPYVQALFTMLQVNGMLYGTSS